MPSLQRHKTSCSRNVNLDVVYQGFVSQVEGGLLLPLRHKTTVLRWVAVEGGLTADVSAVSYS